MKNGLLLLGFRFFFLTVATYGVFYFSYKYYIPWQGGSDFSFYYHMYRQPMDFEQTHAPFIYRQLSAIITNGIYRLGVYYPNEISFVHQGYDQRIFFSALFSNYVALLLTAMIVGETVNRKVERTLLCAPIIGGLLCFVSFFTQQAVITGLAEGWSWFLVAVGFYGYVSRRLLMMLPVLFLSIFQRETIPILFCSISSIDILFSLKKKKFDSFASIVAASSIISFLGYIAVRTILIPVAGHESQLEFYNMFLTFLDFRLPSQELIFQGVLSQNIYFVFISTILVLMLLKNQDKRQVKDFLESTYLIQITCTLLVLYLVGLTAGIGHNIGRIAAILTPIIAALTVKHLVDIENVIRHSGDCSTVNNEDVR